MADAQYPSGGVSTSDFKEDGDHYYTTYKFTEHTAVPPVAQRAGVPLGSVRINGDGTVHLIRVKMRVLPTDAAGNATTYQAVCARNGTGALVAMHNTALAFAAGLGLTANTWVNVPAADMVAGFTRVHAGDFLGVTIGSPGVPTDGADPEIEIIVRSDF